MFSSYKSPRRFLSPLASLNARAKSSLSPLQQYLLYSSHHHSYHKSCYCSNNAIILKNTPVLLNHTSTTTTKKNFNHCICRHCIAGGRERTRRCLSTSSSQNYFSSSSQKPNFPTSPRYHSPISSHFHHNSTFSNSQQQGKYFHTNLSPIHNSSTPSEKSSSDSRRVINGRHVAASIKQRLKEEVVKFQKTLHMTPGLALILVGNRFDSTKYVTAKKRTAEEIGMNSFIYQFDEDSVTDADVLKTIEQLNSDTDVHGIVVQLPLPQKLDKQLILDTIHPLKDVDGFQTRNSATALAVMDLLDYRNVPLEGKNAVIIGRSHLVGRPIADRFLERNATVSICHSYTPLSQLKELTRNADIVVSACGVPRIIKKDFLKPGCVVIDVGISQEGNSVVGDVDFEACKEVARAITPVPGGVGPMTVSKLMDATMTAFKRINNIPLEEDELDQPASLINVESGMNKEALENHLKTHEKLWAMSQ